MATSSGAVGTSVVQEKFDKASFADKHSTYSYSVKRQGHDYFLDFSKKDRTESARRRLSYFVGSGAAARSFLLSVDGFLYEAPVTYYSGPGAWNLSPGYDRYSYPFLTRAIAPGCLQCHASGLQPIAGTQNGYALPAFLEGGVGCERCHGPGAAHVAKMKAGNRNGGLAIVNPASLEPDRRASVCAQCHLTGEIRVPRAGKEQDEFIPGQKLSDSAIAFVRSGGSPQMKVTSHVENLAQSACMRGSGDRMWCGTCHDPHSVPAPAEKAAWFRAKCLTCHAASDCKEKPLVRQANKDACIACHMPRNSVTDAEHVVYTDHSIPRRRAPVTGKSAPDAPLAPFGEKTASTRDLGLAYAIVALREQNAVYRERAFHLLRQAEHESPDDAQTLSYLADLYKGRSDDSDAIRLYERLQRVDPTQVSAPVALGAYRMEQGDYEDAIRLWQDALRRNPALVLVRVNLAVALVKTGHPAEARTMLEKALEFSPGLTAARDLLARIR
jgi:predicted CXXCH cytochrome family protein